MADKTEFYRWQFVGYNKNLFSQSHTLAEIVPELKIDEGYTFNNSNSNWEIARKIENCVVKRLGASGSIPFIFVIPYEHDNKVYIKKIEYQVNSNNNVTYFTWTQTDARARDSSTDTYEMDDYALTQNNFTCYNPPYQDYMYDDNAVWASGLLTFPITFNTNIPIFKVASDFDWNSESNDLKDTIHNFMLHLMTPEELIDDDRILEILNAEEDTVPETTEYFYYGQARQLTVDSFGNKQVGSTVLHRGFKIKGQGNVSLYMVEGIDDGYLKFRLNIGITPLICYYSNDTDIYGNGTWQNMISSPTSLPFNFVYREWFNEVGTFWCSGSANNIGYNTNCLLFKNKADSDFFNSTGEGANKAINYNQVLNGYDINNLTGEQDSATQFGENYTRAFFSQCYLCNVSAIQEISNNLFDYDVTTLQGVWEDIKKGLEMYGSNPMDVVQGCRFYPFNLTDIFTDVAAQNYVYFGAYRLALTNNIYKVIHANGYKDLGSVLVQRTFNDWRDFEPYTKLSIYLPYIGRFPLKPERYYGKNVNIRYYVDIRTGLACACLIADGVLLDWFDGQIGTEMPITLTDYASYAQTQVNTILRNATIGIGAEGMAGNVAVKGIKSALNYNQNAQAVQEAALMSPSTSSLSAQTAGSYGTQAIAGAAIGSAALVGAVGVGTAMKTAYDLMKTGTAANTSVKGSSSSMLNSFLPQYPTFMFEILEIDESPYLNELYGRPSNASGRIGDFSGYLEAEDVMLICPIATDSERQEIIDLVRSGIYI